VVFLSACPDALDLGGGPRQNAERGKVELKMDRRRLKGESEESSR